MGTAPFTPRGAARKRQVRYPSHLRDMPPKPITYLTGDATAPREDGPKIIAHVCNDSGGWGRGFVVALSKRWPGPEADYRAWARAGAPTFALGAAKLVQVEADLWVANMVAQHGTRASKARPPIRYDALRSALLVVAREASERSASVHMPRIGCGLAGGRWEEVEPIIRETLGAAEVATFVYDFELTS